MKLEIIAIAFIGGMILGCVHFGGLYCTVTKVPETKNPTTMLLTSAILRILITVIGFYLIMAGSWEKLVFALLGFLTVRQVFFVMESKKLCKEPTT